MKGLADRSGHTDMIGFDAEFDHEGRILVMSFCDGNTCYVVQITSLLKDMIEHNPKPSVPSLPSSSSSSSSSLKHGSKIPLPLKLTQLLKSSSIKTGVAINEDMNKVMDQFVTNDNGRLSIGSIIDVQTLLSFLMPDKFGQTKKTMRTGMQFLVLALFDYRMNKVQQASNWNDQNLTPDQVKYAGFDAFWSLRITREIQSRLYTVRECLEKANVNVDYIEFLNQQKKELKKMYDVADKERRKKDEQSQSQSQSQSISESLSLSLSILKPESQPVSVSVSVSLSVSLSSPPPQHVNNLNNVNNVLNADDRLIKNEF